MDFLTPTYDDASKTISINIDDFSENYKGSYNLFAVFSQPGDKSYEMGVTLDIFDICEENSSFDAAPELS